MRKLLAANFARLWRSKVFWGLECFCLSFGVFAYILVALNTQNLGQGWLEYNAHAYFYFSVLFVAAIIAIFACFFIGTEYSDGTIRNKLVVGHSRAEIYLSFFLIVCLAAVLFLLAYVLAALVIGLPLSGTAVLTHVELQSWRIVSSLLVTAEYAAIFTLLSMLDSNKARNAVISLLTAAVIIVAGMMVYGRYSEPEFVNHVVALPDGGIALEEGLPNSKYLSGTVRTVVGWITIVLPSGSVMLSLDRRMGFDWRNPAVSVILIVLITIAGIRLFKKKDIK